VELADTSAWVVSRRKAAGRLGEEFDERMLRLEIGICDMVRFELLKSARNGEEMARLSQRFDALPNLSVDGRIWKRALWVYQQLADLGGAHHRSVGHPDLLIAATAEVAEVAVVHYDADFDRVAAITGQPTRWIAPRGSI
jgi:predicted nucleic acid-binding protein